MQTNISDDSKEIINRYWEALVGCPVSHPLYGFGYIESYSNESFTILIDETIEESRYSRTTIHLSKFNKNYETWSVNCEEFRAMECRIAQNLYACINLVHTHLCMRDVLDSVVTR